MRSLSPSLTRGTFLAATGGEAPVFDCLECESGVYVGCTYRPVCACCGALAADDVWRVMRSVLAPSRAA